MSKLFSKGILFCPTNYSIHGTFNKIIDILCESKISIDIRKYTNAFNLQIHSQLFRAPYLLREAWNAYFIGRLNKRYFEILKKEKPDIIFIYNSEFFLSETIRYLKNKTKVVYFIGDSPFYTHSNDKYLASLFYADLILSPDSFWIKQLNVLGIKNISFFVPGVNYEDYFKLDSINEDKITSTEILYAGKCYTNSWGYKKALLMNEFAGFDLKIYGNKHWKKWFHDFPALSTKFIESPYIPTPKLNAMINKTKLVPVDGNPGILNGCHLRLFEALGAGALPLVEYRDDVKNLIFKNSPAMVPMIKNYEKASELAQYYLKNETERLQLQKELNDFVQKEYSARNNAEYILYLLGS